MSDKPAAKRPKGFQPGNKLGKQFQPGNVANPRGRPRKELCLTSIAKAQLEANPELAQSIVKEWLSRATLSDPALRELLDRTEGKVTLPVEHGVAEGLKELLEGLRANRGS